MAAKKGRGHRLPGEPTVLIQGRVPLEVRQMASAAADELGESMALYIEALVRFDAEHRAVRGPQQERLPA